jgi:hypothetical protein
VRDSENGRSGEQKKRETTASQFSDQFLLISIMRKFLVVAVALCIIEKPKTENYFY